jgi:hypothetical protein
MDGRVIVAVALLGKARGRDIGDKGKIPNSCLKYAPGPNLKIIKDSSPRGKSKQSPHLSRLDAPPRRKLKGGGVVGIIIFRLIEEWKGGL